VRAPHKLRLTRRGKFRVVRAAWSVKICKATIHFDFLGDRNAQR
jgi:hypothetical protein